MGGILRLDKNYILMQVCAAYNSPREHLFHIAHSSLLAYDVD